MKIEEELLNLMAKGDINHALKEIRHYVDNDRELKREWALASSRWKDINVRFQRGTVSEEVYNQDRNAFGLYLITLIEAVSEKQEQLNLYGRRALGTINDDDFFQVYSNLKTPDEIWSGFVKDFKSYNDSWLMEYICPEDYLAAHISRYRDPNCGNYYFLFFPNSNGEKSHWQPFIRFAKFQALVHLGLKPYEIVESTFKQTLKDKLKGPLPDTLKYVNAYLNLEEIPQQTFFRGYKYDSKQQLERVSIWYLMLDNDDELPGLILKSANEDFWMELDKKWNNSRKKSKRLAGKKIFEQVLELPDELFEHEVLVD